MRRLPRPSSDTSESVFVGRARMAERHVMTVTHEIANQINRAVEFGGDGDDPDVRSRGGNLVENLGAGEFAIGRSSWQPQAIERLGTVVVGADEIALEMRRKHARGERRKLFGS